MPRRRLIHEDLTRSVIGAFYEVYNVLGFGFLEHIYIPALEHELRARGHRIAREVWVTVFFKGMVMGKQRLDMVVDEKLVVEVKSTYDLRSGALRQLHNYLCAKHLQVGLFLHFGPEPKFYRMVSARPPTGSV
jgi:GxxExxY protein